MIQTKICKKCGRDDRFPSGGCRPCGLAYAAQVRDGKPTRTRHVEIAGVRVCDKCGGTERTPDGRCYPCKRERKRVWRAANAEQHRAYSREWHRANADRANESKNRARKARRDHRALLADLALLRAADTGLAAYNQREIEREVAAQRRAIDYAQRTERARVASDIAELRAAPALLEREERAETQRAYRLIEDRLRSRLREACRQDRVTRHRSSKYSADWAACVERLGPCPGPSAEWHLDHIIPICAFDLHDQAQVWTLNSPANLRWLPKAENERKAQRDRDEWSGAWKRAWEPRRAVRMPPPLRWTYAAKASPWLSS